MSFLQVGAIVLAFAVLGAHAQSVTDGALVNPLVIRDKDAVVCGPGCVAGIVIGAIIAAGVALCIIGLCIKNYCYHDDHKGTAVSEPYTGKEVSGEPFADATNQVPKSV